MKVINVSEFRFIFIAYAHSASHSESLSISSVLEMLMHNVSYEVSVGLANFFLLKYSL